METKKEAELSTKYCSKLGADVTVLKTEHDGNIERKCLSSHLCDADKRMTCDVAGIKNDKNIF
ncbi:MAG: hypothetical protein KBS59_08020 [Clostridiales bacterium]|nr:hypothetical protein [Clostridiales bacterium]